ncbi:glucosamine inositolphosphorylceramide transferase family protein [Algoriphagus confluentis]|uniref:Formyl transferase N-terminal domain-containing protein n=1 Tax=Algoriphagus confluentis TaxID=1697556 RepID=A0ABQ6PNN7_9BACT|nr:hypothetical protein Aconfl_22210 [Algoriphagus confluentis]
MIRIVLLLDSLDVAAWVWEAINQVKKVPNAQIVLAVINKTPKSSGKKSPFLYRLYRWADRKLFLKQPDAFARKNLTSLPNWEVPELQVKPIQKKYSDYLDSETIEQIHSYQPDLILRFGFRILRGEILNLSRLGVWSYHHGDIEAYRGGPPCFWEVIRQEETTGVVLQQLTDKLDDGQVLYQSCSQTDPLSVQRNANKIFWLSASFMARVLKEIEVMGEEEWKKTILEFQKPDPRHSPILTPPDTGEMLGIWINLWGRNLARKIKEGFKKPHWEITYASKVKIGEKLPAFQVIFNSEKKLKKGGFRADPFPLDKDGETWVFYEEFDPDQNKGKLGVGKWMGSQLVQNCNILEESHHLSYPFVWEDKEQVFLIAESGEAGKIFRYRAKNFPYAWERLGVFFEGEGYDPTLFRHKDRYWLFLNQKPLPGTSPFVELYAYWTWDLENPQWTPHALNPIVSDVRSSRPAGKIFSEGNRLFRPAQDSGKRYGHRIIIQEILCLSETEYSEMTVQIISPDESMESLGTHTFNFTQDWIFSDAYFRK